MIKEKIEKENYVNAVVIGYTAEIGEEVEEKCKNVNSKIFFFKLFDICLSGWIYFKACQ